MTDAERNVIDATETFRRFVTMLSGTTAHLIGWREVALVLAASASDALAEAAREFGPVPPERGGLCDQAIGQPKVGPRAEPWSEGRSEDRSSDEPEVGR